MTKKTSLIILSLLLFGILTIVGLNKISIDIKAKNNNFSRLFPPHFLNNPKMMDVKYNSYYIAGLTPSHIYLGNNTAPSYMLITNYSLTDSNALRLRIPDNGERIVQPALQLSVDSPSIYLSDGNSSAVLYSTLPSLNLSLHKPDSINNFNKFIGLPTNSYLVRTYDTSFKRNVLIKEFIYSKQIIRSSNILEKQIDGFFCTDGMINYSAELGWIVYVYYYRNQFICTDANLNILYRGKTIDTIEHAKIRVASIESENSTTLSAPPLTVNKKSCVSGNWLFINSGLLSSNEDAKAFNNSSVIDMYSLKDGRYHFSFYLPDLNRKKINHFKVYHNTLIAIYDHFLMTFTLNLLDN